MQMPMTMAATVTIKPAPTDTEVRKYALSAMDICLKNMPDDIAYGKLLFKIIKEFDWKKLDEDEKDELSKKDEKSVEEKLPEEGLPEDKLEEVKLPEETPTIVKKPELKEGKKKRKSKKK